MRRAISTVLFYVLFMGAALSGCATPGNRTGYLSNYENLGKGQYLKGFHAAPEFYSGSIPSISVKDIDISRAGGAQSDMNVNAATYFKNSLQVYAKKYGVDHIFIFDSSASAQTNLELALTKVDAGSRAGRVWAGEFGVGHAIVQAEGRILSSDGKELASFSEQRRSSGAAGLRDIGSDSGSQLVNEMLDQLASNIILEISSKLKAK